MDGCHSRAVSRSHRNSRWHGDLWGGPRRPWRQPHQPLKRLPEGGIGTEQQETGTLKRVTFFGAEYSAQGMHPDPKKVQGITEMTAPTDKQQLQSFLGMVNYMGTFIPNLSHHTEPLRAMLKKDNVFHWEDQQTRSFQQVKTLIAKANTTLLRYYDRNLPVTVQVDASLRGLGACLIQTHKGKDQPIAFASKSLTDTETRYANIERELLAIVFACQRFSTYLLGRSFVAESDHKPLEIIAMKNLANAPPRLQRMLLELQRYDVTIKYRPGKEMQLADALSRCPARASQEIKLDMRVDYIAFTKPWIEKLKDSTQRDPILATVYQLTQQGWPHQRRHVPRLARRYWDFRDELSTDDGMLLKGPRLIIPGELQGVSKPSARRPSLSKQGTGKCQTTYVLDWNWRGHRRLHQEMPRMYQKVSSTQGAPPASWHSRGPLEETGYWLFCLQWQLICLDLWLLLEIPFPLQSQNIILVIKGPSNRSLFNWRASRRDSIRQLATVPEQGVCQISLWLGHQAHHLITRVSPF